MNLLTADIVEKFYTLLWPLARIAAALMTAPIISVEAANARMRLMLALGLTLLVMPLFTWPVVDPFTVEGMALLLKEIGIGILMGLSLQVVTGAAVVAGQAISNSMGLSMANLIDPNLGNVPLLSQFLLILATLIFFSIGGPLLLMSALVDSFTALPVGQSDFGLDAITRLLSWSSMIFLGGLLIALPVLAMLLLLNIGVGIMTRAAPSLNMMAVGVPATLMAGLVVMYVTVASISSRLEWLWLQAFMRMRDVVGIG